MLLPLIAARLRDRLDDMVGVGYLLGASPKLGALGYTYQQPGRSRPHHSARRANLPRLRRRQSPKRRRFLRLGQGPADTPRVDATASRWAPTATSGSWRATSERSAASRPDPSVATVPGPRIRAHPSCWLSDSIHTCRTVSMAAVTRRGGQLRDRRAQPSRSALASSLASRRFDVRDAVVHGAG